MRSKTSVGHLFPARFFSLRSALVSLRSGLALSGVLALTLTACGGGGGGGGGAPANQAPSANAGTDQRANPGAAVSLRGNGSDSDGRVVSFAWTQTSGAAVSLSGASTDTASFTAPANGTLVFRLTVTDDKGSTGSDDVAVAINAAPTANAGSDRRVPMENPVTLTATGSDPENQALTWKWTQVSGPAVNLGAANTAAISFTAPATTGEVVLRATATDDLGLTASDDIALTVVAELNLVGTVTFDFLPRLANGALDRNNPKKTPSQGVTVEAVGADNSTLASASTDDKGGFVLANVPMNREMKIRVKAQMKRTGTPSWQTEVVDNTQNAALYSVVSASFNSGKVDQLRKDIHAGSGWDGSQWARVRPAAPLALLDAVRKAQQKVLQAVPNLQFTPVKLNWSVDNVLTAGADDPARGLLGASYYLNGEIFILGDMSPGGDSDEYDDHVVVHEWGHYFEDKHSRSDSIGGSHSLSNRLDIRVAFGEGFGNAWSAIATDDPIYADADNGGADIGVFFNLEDNGSNTPGWASERIIQGVLYDLYDGGTELGDTVALGVAPLINVFMNGQKNTDAMTSIFSFADHLLRAQTADAAAIRSLLSARNMTGTGINEFAQGELVDGGNSGVLPVYTPLSVNGAAVKVCSLDDYHTSYKANKLGVHRFVHFNVPSAGNYRIRITPEKNDADAAAWLFKRGTRLKILDIGGDGEAEDHVENLQAGVHVLGVYEFGNTPELWESPKNTALDACFNVQVSSN